jgi:predicted ATP-binding protein involved in virulence
VINVVGEIKRDSLVVIDEPELFLHPRLEVEFVGLLKKINSAFNSCAILATHSLSIARETPSKCVHVLRQLEDGLDVIHPPFETFGGDMQRISTYVFGDDTFSKPFDEWLTQKLDSISNPHELIRSLGREVNEELVIKILNYEKAHGRENSSTN